MAKFFASDNHVASVNIEGARTGITREVKRDNKGFFNVESAADIAALKGSGFVEASLSGVTSSAVGYDCSGCGFGSFFAVCSRCGTDNTPKDA